ncbi:MAG: acyl-CoA dehydrogenase [Proteobacteria bacterium]|nr:MAG: acyl-CoA dehydrogenase [Pseudomonadota bacterium]
MLENGALSDHSRELRDHARVFVERVLEPAVAEMQQTQAIPKSVHQALKTAGYFGMTVPEQYGGLGLGLLDYAVILEQIGWSHRQWTLYLANNNGLASKAIGDLGTEEQRDRYLRGLATGDFLACFALTEPEAGSDAGAISTRASKAGNKWIINGRKHYISAADIADVTVVIAVTDKEKGARGGMTAFLVDSDNPGRTIARTHNTIGIDAVKQSEILFENCEVDEDAVLGEVGGGFKTAMRTLDEGRITVAASCVGHAQRCLDLMVEHARERKTFGKPLGSRQAIQWMIADSATEIHAARTMVYNAAARSDQGERISQDASMAKLFASEMISRVADRAIQIHGGAGIMNEVEVGRWWCDTRHYRIGEGASEIQRTIISRNLLGSELVSL